MPDLVSHFDAAVARHPDRVAIVDGKGRAVTFAELRERSSAYTAAWHHQGIGAGDRVLLAMTVDADLYAALAALWSLGATAVLPEPAMGIAGLRHAARVTNVKAFCSSGVYGLLKYGLPELWRLHHLRPKRRSMSAPAPAARRGSDIALISFTSGTSGAPKGIPRSHDFLLAQHRAITPLLHSEQPERDLVAFPVFVLINIVNGHTSVLPNWRMSRIAELDPRQLNAWITKQRVTRALLPPSLCTKLTDQEISASLLQVFTGGGPVFPELLQRLCSAKPDLKITCVYGSTEAEPIAHLAAAEVSEDDFAAMREGKGLLVGLPVSDVHVRIVEQEIQVAGPHVNNGYLDPDHNAENKLYEGDTVWHRTGDTGYFDELGRLWLLGRVGSSVYLENQKVYPFSVEVAVRQWPGVRQCALVPGRTAAYLVIEGDKRHAETWQRLSVLAGIRKVIPVKKIPMDKRHASKIDRKALASLTLH